MVILFFCISVLVQGYTQVVSSDGSVIRVESTAGHTSNSSAGRFVRQESTEGDTSGLVRRRCEPLWEGYPACPRDGVIGAYCDADPDVPRAEREPEFDVEIAEELRDALQECLADGNHIHDFDLDVSRNSDVNDDVFAPAVEGLASLCAGDSVHDEFPLRFLRLDFSGTSIHGTELFPALRECTSLERLALFMDQSSVGADRANGENGMHDLARALEALQELRSFSMDVSLAGRIGDGGAMALGEVLPTLKELHIVLIIAHHANIHDAGAVALVEGLATPIIKDLTLDLAHNKITSAGVQDIGEALCSSGETMLLKDLNLKLGQNRAIDDAGVEALGESLCKCKHLESVEISLKVPNAVSDEGMDALEAILKACVRSGHGYVYIEG